MCLLNDLIDWCCGLAIYVVLFVAMLTLQAELEVTPVLNIRNMPPVDLDETPKVWHKGMDD